MSAGVQVKWKPARTTHIVVIQTQQVFADSFHRSSVETNSKLPTSFPNQTSLEINKTCRLSNCRILRFVFLHVSKTYI